MDNLSEQEVIDKAKTDSEYFGRLFDKYYDQIYRYIFKRTCNPDIAKDLVSETFFKALKNIKKYQHRGYAFSAWLYRISTSEISNYYREQKKQCQITLEEAPQLINKEQTNTDYEILNIQDKEGEKKIIEAILKNVKNLKTLYQDILTLQYYEKKTLEEISIILQRPIGTIKSYKHRAIKKLRQLIIEDKSNPITYEPNIRQKNRRIPV